MKRTFLHFAMFPSTKEILQCFHQRFCSFLLIFASWEKRKLEKMWKSILIGKNWISSAKKLLLLFITLDAHFRWNCQNILKRIFLGSLPDSNSILRIFWRFDMLSWRNFIFQWAIVECQSIVGILISKCLCKRHPLFRGFYRRTLASKIYVLKTVKIELKEQCERREEFNSTVQWTTSMLAEVRSIYEKLSWTSFSVVDTNSWKCWGIKENFVENAKTT